MIRSACLALALMATPALAHPGGLAADGCHKERATGTRHCHPERAGGGSAPAPRAVRPRAPQRLAATPGAAGVDSDVAEIVALFGRLSASDRASVILIAQRLAGD